MIKYSLCKKCIGMFLQNNIKICLLTSVHLLFRKLSICMFFCVHHFKYHSRERVYFKFSMCVCYWILSRQYARGFDQKLVSHKKICHKQHLCPLGKRESKFSFLWWETTPQYLILCLKFFTASLNWLSLNIPLSTLYVKTLVPWVADRRS